MSEPAPVWTVVALPLVLAALTYSAAAMDAALHTGGGAVAPLRETVRLIVQQRRRTLAPDAPLTRIGVLSLPAAALLAATVLPLGDGAVWNLPVGIVWFNAREVVAWGSLWLTGWGVNSAFPLVGGYRFVAQGLAYELPHMFALITAGLGAGSLSFTAVAAAQDGLWFAVWMPVAFAVYLLSALGMTFWGPLGHPVSGDLAGGVVAELSGPDRLLFLAGRFALLTVAAGAAVPLFLGGGAGLGEGAERGGRSRFGRLGGKLAGLLGKAGPWLAAGAVVGGVFLKGLEGALEKQDAMAKLKASLGAFGPEADRLGKAAGHLFSRGYGESMGEVTEALGTVVSSIGGMRKASNADLESMTAKALDLASTFDLEVGRAAQVAGQLVKSGLVDNASQGLDLLTASMQQVPAAVREDLVDALDEYSPFLNQIGIKGQKAFNLLVQSADKGMYGLDKTGDALKEFTLRATDMSAGSKAAYDALGLSQKKMAADLLAGGKRGESAFQRIVSGLRSIKDPVEQSQAALALFGTPLEDLSTKDIPKFLSSLDLTKDRLGNTAGAADKMGKTLHQTASQNLTRFQRTMKQKVVDFVGGKILPGLTKFGGKVNAWFQTWVGDNAGTVDKVKAVWSKLGNRIREAVRGVEKWLDQNHDKIEEWGNKIGTIVGSVADIVSSALDVASTLSRIFGPTLLNVIGVFVDTILGYWSGLFRIIQGVWNVFAGIFTGDWGRVWQGIRQIFSGALQAVWSLLKGALRLIRAEWGLVWGLLKNQAHKVWSAVVTVVRSQVSKLKAGVHGLASLPGQVAGWFGRMKDGAVARAKALVSWMRALPGRIRSGLGRLGRLLYSAGRDIMSGLWNGVKSMAGSVRDRMSGLIHDIVPGPVRKVLGIASPSKVMRKIGHQIMQGLHAGLTSSEASKIKSTITRTANLIQKAFKGKKTTLDDRLIAGLSRNNRRLQSIAKKRQALLARMAEAKEYAKSVTGAAREFASITNIPTGDRVFGGELVQGLQARLGALRAFSANITRLAKSGLNKTIMRQIIDAGPEEGGKLAEALASGGKSAIGEINKTQGEMDRVSKQLGLNSADTLYDAGRNASKGFLRGLQSQEKALARQMSRIASGIVRAIRRALKIKSPSQVMASLGGHVSAGLAVGMIHGEGAVTRAAAGLATAAIPTIPAQGQFRVPTPPREVSRPAAQGGVREVRVVLDVRGGDREFRKMIQKWVRVGDLQLVPSRA